MCPPGGRRNRRGRTLAARTHHHSWFLFRYNFFRLFASSSAFRSSPPPARRRRSCRPCGQAQVARRCTGSRPGRRSVAQVYTYSSFYNIIIIIIIITVLYVHDVGSYVNTVIACARARTSTSLVPETDNRWRYGSVAVVVRRAPTPTPPPPPPTTPTRQPSTPHPPHHTGRHPRAVASDGHRRRGRRRYLRTSTQYQQRLNDRVPVSLFPRSCF